MRPELNIDVYFDLVCPWCLIGKAYLERARRRLAEEHPDVQVAVTWHSVQLVPHVPAEGWPFASFYLQRLGNEDAVLRRQAQVRDAAQAAGVTVNFDRISVFPNTRLAHTLVQIVQERQPAAVEPLLDHLFQSYFAQGALLGDGPELRALAKNAGVDGDLIAQAMGSAALPPTFPGMAGMGVPMFAFNGARTVSGAQPAEALFQAMCESIGRC